MGKTVESFRLALEGEINRWSGFARALRKPDLEAFEELMDMCRNNAMAAGNACNPIIFEPMAMFIRLAQQQKLRELEYNLNEVLWEKSVPKKTIQKPLTIPEKPSPRLKANYKVQIKNLEDEDMMKKQSTLFPENEVKVIAELDFIEAERLACQFKAVVEAQCDRIEVAGSRERWLLNYFLLSN